MITYIKQSKIDKVDPVFFTIVKVSMEKENENETSLPYIIPPMSIFIPRKQGNISKGKFLKKYVKYLDENKSAEFAIFNIVKALKNKVSICFTCTDEEFKMGYVQKLAEYLSERFGVSVYEYKEAKEILETELSALDKKQRKLIYKSDEKIDSSKKIKMKNKIIKNINKLVKSDFSECGNDDYDVLDKKFAVEQIMWTSIDSGICSYKKNVISDINEDMISKTKPYVMAILLTADNDKVYRKIIKAVLDANSLKLKKKQLDKLSKVQIISLCGEIMNQIYCYREAQVAEDK